MTNHKLHLTRGLFHLGSSIKLYGGEIRLNRIRSIPSIHWYCTDQNVLKIHITYQLIIIIIAITIMTMYVFVLAKTSAITVTFMVHRALPELDSFINK